MNNFSIKGYCHCFGSIDYPVNVLLAYFTVLHGDYTMAVDPLDMSTGNTGVNRIDFTARH